MFSLAALAAQSPSGRRTALGRAESAVLVRRACALSLQPAALPLGGAGVLLEPKAGAQEVAALRASCSGGLSVEMSSSSAERDAEEANAEAEDARRGRKQSS